MLSPLKVLIVSHSKEIIESVQQAVRQAPTVKSAARLLGNGHVDPLYGIKDLPDVLMLQVSHNWEQELDALNGRPPALRPVVLAVGPSDDPTLLRRAMQAGVRDFLAVPIDPAEVVAALEKIQQEKKAVPGAASQLMTVVLGAKGGAGSTLVASNLAHILVEELKLKTALLDLDLHFGTTALCLNVEPQVGIKDALSAVQEIDSTALRGYMAHHESGLDVLASVAGTFVDPLSVSPQQLDQLLTVVGQTYEHTVIDLPRSIDPFTLTAIARSDRILLVLQQQLSHLQGAKRLLNALRSHQEGVNPRLTVVINRFQKKAGISVRDVAHALDVDFRTLIPNDYKRISEAEEVGVPLFTHSPSAPVTKALRELARNLSGVAPVRRGLLKRIFADQQQRL